MKHKIICGHVLDVLKTMPDESVDTVITSPPYWGLRSYLPDDHPDKSKEIGLEPTLDLYINHLMDVMSELKRVLKKTGVIFWNHGDCYGGSAGGFYDNPDYKGISLGSSHYRIKRKQAPDTKPKCMALQNYRFIMRCVDELGLILRNVIIWYKPNHMPSSVKDRFTNAYEPVFMLVKSRKYWFDLDAVREPHKLPNAKSKNAPNKYKGYGNPTYSGFEWDASQHPLGKNPGDVWAIPTQPFPEAHFACVIPDTKILTIDGWKRYTEIGKYDKWNCKHILVATYNFETKKIEYQPLQYIREYDYDGYLIHVGNRDLDILMTPNHRNVVLKRNGREEVVLAENLAYGDKIKVWAPVDYRIEYSIGEVWAELVGWIISEGHYKQGKYIEIYQNAGGNEDRIDYLLNKAQIPYSKSVQEIEYKGQIKEQVTWFISRCAFTDWMYQYVPNKKLNRLLVSLPKNELKALLKGLISGDGHKRKDDGRMSFIQKDEECVGWFEILAMRCGYHTITSRKNDVWVVYLTKREAIGIRNTNGKGKSIQKVYYKGKVWCPRTPDGTWIAKRNGRIFITGNTFPEKLVEPMIKAGCPQWICKKCGKARERITITELRNRNENIVPSVVSSVKASRAGDSIHYTLDWTNCGCNAGWENGVVLDPFCIHPESEVITMDGMKYAYDVQVGDHVLTHKGRFRKVIKKYERDYEGEFIHLFSSGRSLLLTPNHSILVLEGYTKCGKVFGEIKWKIAENINPKRDFVAFPIYSEEYRVNLEPAFLELIGWYLSEGHSDRYCVYFYGENNKPRLRKLLEHLNINYRKEEKRLAIASKRWARFFSQFGHVAVEKRIPLWLKGASKQELQYVFQGMIRGDGCIKNDSKHKGVYYSTSSPSLAWDTVLLSTKLGLFPRFHNYRPDRNVKLPQGRKLKYTPHKSYTLSFQGKQIKNMAFIQKFDEARNSFWHQKEGLIFTKPKVLRLNYSGKVYNFQVEDDNSYVSGGIIVHNCGSGTVGVVAEKLGRNAILIDLNKEYCEMAYRRIKKVTAQTKLGEEPSIIERVGF